MRKVRPNIQDVQHREETHYLRMRQTANNRVSGTRVRLQGENPGSDDAALQDETQTVHLEQTEGDVAFH